MIRKLLVFVLALSVAPIPTTNGQSVSPARSAGPVTRPEGPTSASLQPRLTEVDSLIAADFARRHIGSVTAGVVLGDRLIWTKSYGDSDMEKKIPATQDTVYRIGSVTKMFTALMLDQLVDAGKVHLSDPVERFFPEVKTIPKGSFPDAPPITLLQLATHTAGLAEEPDDMDTYVKGPVADWEKTLTAALPHLRYILEPGTRYAYSNIGYAILGAAISRAAGQPYMDYIPKSILEPLGMSHSALQTNSKMLPNLSRGYEAGPGGRIDSDLPAREHEGRGYKMPNGAMYTTVGDLALFASYFMGQGHGEMPKSASLERAIAQSKERADADPASGYSYGIGFEVRRRQNYTAFGHSGAVAGYSAGLYANRRTGVAVIVLANTGGIANLGLRALDVLSR